MIKTLILIASLASSCTTLKKPFFYEISNQDGKAYLLGTIHVGVPANDLPSDVISKLEAAKDFALEMDPFSQGFLKANYGLMGKELTKIVDAYFQYSKQAGSTVEQGMLQTTTNPPNFGKRLTKKNSDYLSKTSLKYIFKKVGDSAELSPQTAYFYLLATAPKYVEVTHAEMKSLDDRFSMDTNLIEIAKKNKLVLHPLDDDLIFTTKCSDIVFNELLSKYFDDSDSSFLNQTNELFKIYREGDERAILKMTSAMGSKEFYQCLFINRNQAWFKKIHNTFGDYQLNHRPPPFIAVGVGHLVGDDSLLELFKTHGYMVRRITPE